MGTFHHDKGSLHGMTVVVETQGARVFVGRCDTQTEKGIVLLDADAHDDGEGGRGREEYLRQVARLGHWKKHERLIKKQNPKQLLPTAICDDGI